MNGGYAERARKTEKSTGFPIFLEDKERQLCFSSVGAMGSVGEEAGEFEFTGPTAYSPDLHHLPQLPFIGKILSFNLLLLLLNTETKNKWL